MKNKKNKDASTDKIVEDLFENGEVSFELFNFTNDDEEHLTDILEICLHEIGKESIFNYIKFCFKELLGNAKKANIKRLYFLDKKLDINNPEDYKKGMDNFKHDLMEDHSRYIALLDEKKYYVKVIFKVEDDDFFLYVINNGQILEQELKVALEKIKNAKEFKSIEEAFVVVQQNKEGAGLGIIITVLMLKEMGLSTDNFSITKKDNETHIYIKLPLSMITPRQKELINELIINEINKLPKFPQHILELQNKLNNPETHLNEILKVIASDPSVVADILKAANSAEFMLKKKLSSIKDAITFLGFKRLKNILYIVGTQRVLSDKFDLEKMKSIWSNSYKVAFYSFNLAKKYLKKDLEDAFIGGILHDIGKIVLLGINPGLVQKITIICQEKSIPIRIMEDLTNGYNHSFIGSKIAEKWNFPPVLINILKHHHAPWSAPEEHKKINFCIYLADIIAKNEDIDKSFKETEKSALDFFKLSEYDDFKNLVSSLNGDFDKDKFKKRN